MGVRKTVSLKGVIILILVIALLSIAAVYYFGEESVPGEPLPDESTNIVPSSMKQ